MRLLEGVINFFLGRKTQPQSQPTFTAADTGDIPQQSQQPTNAPPLNENSTEKTNPPLTSDTTARTENPTPVTPEEGNTTLTQPNASTLTGSSLNPSHESLHAAAEGTLVQPTQTDQEALMRRLAFSTSFFEAPSDAWLRRSPVDAPPRLHADRFYVCSGDKRDGLTIGYGTFFTKEGALIKADEDILDLVTFAQYKTNEQGEKISVPVQLSREEKKRLIKNLLQNMGTSSNVNQRALRSFPYHITQESADALLLHRFKEKRQELNRLIGPQNNGPLFDWLATDLHYQGMLESPTLKQMLREGKILKSKKRRPDNDYLPLPNLNKEGDPDLRDLGRRIVADYYEIIKTKYPFSPHMTQEERANHAEQLHKYVAAYAGEILGSYRSLHMTLGVSRAFIREMATLGSIQIEYDRLGRNLTEKEIAKIKQKARENCEAYYLLNTPEKERVEAARQIVTNSKAILDKTTTTMQERAMQPRQANLNQHLTESGLQISQENTPATPIQTKNTTHR